MSLENRCDQLVNKTINYNRMYNSPALTVNPPPRFAFIPAEVDIATHSLKACNFFSSAYNGLLWGGMTIATLF